MPDSPIHLTRIKIPKFDLSEVRNVGYNNYVLKN